MYFKICALYFKISALYFFLCPMCFEKRPKRYFANRDFGQRKSIFEKQKTVVRMRYVHRCRRNANIEYNMIHACGKEKFLYIFATN